MFGHLGLFVIVLVALFAYDVLKYLHASDW
jgi:hypothetical protein